MTELDIVRKVAASDPWHYSRERGCDVCRYCGVDRTLLDFPDPRVRHDDAEAGECVWQQAVDFMAGDK